MNTTIVNTAALLQVYFRYKFEGGSGKGIVDFGRFTMDIGTWRLVARNVYRNTINTFTGLRAKYTTNSGVFIYPFFVLPVRRFPVERRKLLKNEFALDEQRPTSNFWGLFARVPDLFYGLSGDFSFYGLHETDRPDWPTANRKLYTPMARIFKAPRRGEFDYSVESIFQWGSSHKTILNEDMEKLRHLAFFQRIEIGYTLRCKKHVRIQVEFDYASGDRDPEDGKNGRFDSLFGPDRFDFGPTSMWATFSRTNLISPGIKVVAEPYQQWNLVAAHRAYWLAQARDTWRNAGLWDPEGMSGDHLGQQSELIIQWKFIPGNLEFELGLVHLFLGDYPKSFSNSSDYDPSDSSYGYLQAVFSF